MYPDCIKNLPKAKIDFPGVQGWVAQGDNHQIVFFEIEPTGEVPPHSHAAQFGSVFEGEIVLTIGDEVRTYTKGDTYYIPAVVIHKAKFKTFTRVMDFFDDPNRYETE
ncbi:MAG: cupin domain-containing protein [Candidatus Thorarchaeota archaeon]